MKEIRGYKVFNKDWTCRGKQYTCPGVFEEDVNPSCCDRGMHFCVNLSKCFNYYRFDPENKVAEVIALGDIDVEGDKACTNKIQILREISWEEVLRLVNTGNANTGFGNSGDGNSGDGNSGHHNSGDWNSGDWNSGDWNSGDGNSGHHNSGDGNSGDGNSGDWNSGDGNSGDHNSGRYNSGDWNKTNFSSGCFNTKKTNIMLFNKMSNWTYRDWLDSEARRLLNGIPRWRTKWVPADNMTEQEKADHSSYKVTGGYFKILNELEEAQKWWNNLSVDEQETIKSIPNFDPDIFEECTGIKV